MRAKIVVEPAAEFRSWVDGLERTVPPSLEENMRVDERSKRLKK